MEYIKSTVLTLCITILLIGFIYRLFPQGKLQKSMKTILSLVLILVLISPLIGNRSDINLDYYNKTFALKSNELPDYSAYRTGIISKAVGRYEGEIKAIFNKNGIKVKEVRIITAEKSEGTDVVGADIILYSETEIENAKRLAKDKLSIPVTIKVE